MRSIKCQKKKILFLSKHRNDITSVHLHQAIMKVKKYVLIGCLLQTKPLIGRLRRRFLQSVCWVQEWRRIQRFREEQSRQTFWRTLESGHLWGRYQREGLKEQSEE